MSWLRRTFIQSCAPNDATTAAFITAIYTAARDTDKNPDQWIQRALAFWPVFLPRVRRATEAARECWKTKWRRKSMIYLKPMCYSFHPFLLLNTISSQLSTLNFFSLTMPVFITLWGTTEASDFRNVNAFISSLGCSPYNLFCFSLVVHFFSYKESTMGMSF